MRRTEQNTSQGVKVISFQLAADEIYELANHQVTGISVFAASRPAGEKPRPVHYYLAGPKAVQGPFYGKDITKTIPPVLRAPVSRLIPSTPTKFLPPRKAGGRHASR